jgi:hypothetical protein
VAGKRAGRFGGESFQLKLRARDPSNELEREEQSSARSLCVV